MEPTLQLPSQAAATASKSDENQTLTLGAQNVMVEPAARATAKKPPTTTAASSSFMMSFLGKTPASLQPRKASASEGTTSTPAGTRAGLAVGAAGHAPALFQSPAESIKLPGVPMASPSDETTVGTSGPSPGAASAVMFGAPGDRQAAQPHSSGSTATSAASAAASTNAGSGSSPAADDAPTDTPAATKPKRRGRPPKSASAPAAAAGAAAPNPAPLTAAGSGSAGSSTGTAATAAVMQLAATDTSVIEVEDSGDGAPGAASAAPAPVLPKPSPTLTGAAAKAAWAVILKQPAKTSPVDADKGQGAGAAGAGAAPTNSSPEAGQPAGGSAGTAAAPVPGPPLPAVTIRAPSANTNDNGRTSLEWSKMFGRDMAAVPGKAPAAGAGGAAAPKVPWESSKEFGLWRLLDVPGPDLVHVTRGGNVLDSVGFTTAAPRPTVPLAPVDVCLVPDPAVQAVLARAGSVVDQAVLDTVKVDTVPAVVLRPAPVSAIEVDAALASPQWQAALQVLASGLPSRPGRALLQDATAVGQALHDMVGQHADKTLGLEECLGLAKRVLRRAVLIAHGAQDGPAGVGAGASSTAPTAATPYHVSLVIDVARSALLKSSNACSSPFDATWPVKYRPTLAEDVCGNSSSVRKLRRFLSDWREAAALPEDEFIRMKEEQARAEAEAAAAAEAANAQAKAQAKAKGKGKGRAKGRGGHDSDGESLVDDEEEACLSDGSLFDREGGDEDEDAASLSDQDDDDDDDAVHFNLKEVRAEVKEDGQARQGRRSRRGRGDGASMASSSDGHSRSLGRLLNIALLQGPTGSGKTSAVYACAEELGYSVIEVHPGQARDRATLLATLREATQSRRVRLTAGQTGLGKTAPTQSSSSSSTAAPAKSSVLMSLMAGTGKAGAGAGHVQLDHDYDDGSGKVEAIFKSGAGPVEFVDGAGASRKTSAPSRARVIIDSDDDDDAGAGAGGAASAHDDTVQVLDDDEGMVGAGQVGAGPADQQGAGASGQAAATAIDEPSGRGRRASSRRAAAVHYVDDDEEDGNADEEEQEEDERPKKRGRGRPPKAAGAAPVAKGKQGKTKSGEAQAAPEAAPAPAPAPAPRTLFSFGVSAVKPAGPAAGVGGGAAKEDKDNDKGKDKEKGGKGGKGKSSALGLANKSILSMFGPAGKKDDGHSTSTTSAATSTGAGAGQDASFTDLCSPERLDTSTDDCVLVVEDGKSGGKGAGAGASSTLAQKPLPLPAPVLDPRAETCAQMFAEHVAAIKAEAPAVVQVEASSSSEVPPLSIDGPLSSLSSQSQAVVSQGGPSQAGPGAGQANGSGAALTLLLFESADVLFPSGGTGRDVAFLAALAELAEDSRCPIVLTVSKPLLGRAYTALHGLSMMRLHFPRPPPGLLSLHLQAVALAEGFPLSPKDLSRLVLASQCDMRTALLQLQVMHSRLPVPASSSVLPAGVTVEVDRARARLNTLLQSATALVDSRWGHFLPEDKGKDGDGQAQTGVEAAASVPITIDDTASAGGASALSLPVDTVSSTPEGPAIVIADSPARPTADQPASVGAAGHDAVVEPEAAPAATPAEPLPVPHPVPTAVASDSGTAGPGPAAQSAAPSGEVMISTAVAGGASNDAPTDVAVPAEPAAPAAEMPASAPAVEPAPAAVAPTGRPRRAAAQAAQARIKAQVEQRDFVDHSMEEPGQPKRGRRGARDEDEQYQEPSKNAAEHARLERRKLRKRKRQEEEEEEEGQGGTKAGKGAKAKAAAAAAAAAASAAEKEAERRGRVTEVVDTAMDLLDAVRAGRAQAQARADGSSAARLAGMASYRSPPDKPWVNADEDEDLDPPPMVAVLCPAMVGSPVLPQVDVQQDEGQAPVPVPVPQPALALRDISPTSVTGVADASGHDSAVAGTLVLQGAGFKAHGASGLDVAIAGVAVPQDCIRVENSSTVVVRLTQGLLRAITASVATSGGESTESCLSHATVVEVPRATAPASATAVIDVDAEDVVMGADGEDEASADEAAPRGPPVPLLLVNVTVSRGCHSCTMSRCLALCEEPLSSLASLSPMTIMLAKGGKAVDVMKLIGPYLARLRTAGRTAMPSHLRGKKGKGRKGKKKTVAKPKPKAKRLASSPGDDEEAEDATPKSVGVTVTGVGAKRLRKAVVDDDSDGEGQDKANTTAGSDVMDVTATSVPTEPDQSPEPVSAPQAAAGKDEAGDDGDEDDLVRAPKRLRPASVAASDEPEVESSVGASSPPSVPSRSRASSTGTGTEASPDQAQAQGMDEDGQGHVEQGARDYDPWEDIPSQVEDDEDIQLQGQPTTDDNASPDPSADVGTLASMARWADMCSWCDVLSVPRGHGGTGAGPLVASAGPVPIHPLLLAWSTSGRCIGLDREEEDAWQAEDVARARPEACGTANAEFGWAGAGGHQLLDCSDNIGPSARLARALVSGLGRTRTLLGYGQGQLELQEWLEDGQDEDEEAEDKKAQPTMAEAFGTVFGATKPKEWNPYPSEEAVMLQSKAPHRPVTRQDEDQAREYTQDMVQTLLQPLCTAAIAREDTAAAELHRGPAVRGLVGEGPVPLTRMLLTDPELLHLQLLGARMTYAVRATALLRMIVPASGLSARGYSVPAGHAPATRSCQGQSPEAYVARLAAVRHMAAAEADNKARALAAAAAAPVAAIDDRAGLRRSTRAAARGPAPARPSAGFRSHLDRWGIKAGGHWAGIVSH